MSSSSGLIKKNYLADQKAFMAHFHAQALLLSAFKSTLLQGALVFNAYVESLDLDDDDTNSDDDELLAKPAKEDKPVFIPPTPYEFAIKVEHTFVRMVSNTTVQRSLEVLSLHFLDVRTAGKLMKDTTKSAVRKYARWNSTSLAAIRISKTAFRASILSNAAVFVVEEIVDAIKTFFNLGSKKPDDTSVFLTRLLLAARKFLQAVIGTTVGGALGTLVSPGKGTFVGAFVGESIGYSL
ncbi:hypothetical protein H310_12436 [Aphanomyces invadans]|uniref:Uncharacterized protein n=1 Tax=Aphanomyces invadans TaxID=157072 RepID=A0A024TI41_9STRA|nr:hypothetical protein H310_12436 [Aphanomyces invadans]ETV93669.1 hypothetical protein H310_12436 [Aphanomyces invadans]|eukprot:XP_008877710.1 hypothetical protein H310_12436 [Aphanomyces invadans]